MSFINTWGCAHFEEDVLKDDFSKYNLGAAVKCIEDNEGILTCQYKSKTVRIYKKGWNPRQTPEFIWNEHVRIKSKDLNARIELICWHLKDEKYFYHLIADGGKNLSKRYYADELEKAD